MYTTFWRCWLLKRSRDIMIDTGGLPDNGSDRHANRRQHYGGRADDGEEAQGDAGPESAVACSCRFLRWIVRCIF